jgi:hypothetical protein
MSDFGYITIDHAIQARGSDPSLDRKFWTDVSRMWPRNWWSPASQWRDFLLRHYARKKLRQVRKRGGRAR